VRSLPPWLGLAAGALCAIAIACGGAKSAMSPPPTAAAAGAMPRAGDSHSHDEIDELSRKIDADLATLGVPRPAPPLAACIQPPCVAEALSAGIRPGHGAEPDCRPGAGDVCRDSCQLSDSICDSSGRICRIASELGGGDAYANEKCASGKASCDAARTKCCGCL
jgi:hypothetical protein